MQAIVHNNQKRPIAYSATVPAREGQPRVQTARVLWPGANQVDFEEFEASTKKSPVWAKWKADGDVQVRVAGDGPSAIAHLKTAEALAVVKDTLNAELLAEWAAEENRPELKKAIAKQQKHLDKTLPKAPEQAA